MSDQAGAAAGHGEAQKAKKACRVCHTAADYMKMTQRAFSGGSAAGGDSSDDAAIDLLEKTARTSSASSDPSSLPAAKMRAALSSFSASSASSSSSTAQASLSSSSAAAGAAAAMGYRQSPPECPADSLQLGRHTWTLLHSAAAYYPDEPKAEDVQAARELVGSLARLYPCHWCVDHLRAYVQKTPVDASSRPALAQWMCNMHNDVNRRTGKPLYDCSLSNLDQRWRDGWHNGSCD